MQIKPDHKSGYTGSYLKKTLPKEQHERFWEWAKGKKVMYDDKTGETVSYACDVQEFLSEDEKQN